MNAKELFNTLLQQYVNNTISAEQKALFFEMLETNAYDDFLSNDILDKIYAEEVDSNIDIPPAEADQLFDRILANNVRSAREKFYKKLVVYIGSVAAISALVFGVWFFYTHQNPKLGEDMLALESSYLEYINTSDSIQQLQLSDNSIVSIYPNSSLTYPETFTHDTRSVSLKGKAFFAVAKDSIHPFIVNSENIVVKVLGTSFLINGNAKTGIEEVEVRSGRVQVDAKEITTKTKEHSLVIYANQKVIYNLKENLLTKTLVAAPLQLLAEDHKVGKPMHAIDFKYNDQKLTTIFKDLEKAYGVHIILANKSLEACAFTGNLAGEDLFTKLQILSIATQMNYKIQDTDIIMDGIGCAN